MIALQRLLKRTTGGNPPDAFQRAELEQAVLRVVLVTLVYFYVVWTVLKDGVVNQEDTQFLIAGAGFVLLGLLILGLVIADRRSSLTRRIVGMLADNGATTYCLIQMDEGGAFVLGVYLFVAFGNGFRFGRAHLHASQVLSIVGFSLVLLLSPFWSKHLVVGMGFMTALAILPFYVAVLAQRITEAKKRADEANQAKGRFLANMSHEMRTPLNGVIAMADVLRETDLTESQRDIVETMTTSAHLLLAQIEDVLDMAKIEAGRVVSEKRPLDLSKLVTSIAKVMLPQARYKGLAVNVEIKPDAGGWWSGDAHHLRQVLLNLLSNAVKFTERGQVNLTVSVAASEADATHIRFEVSDTGIGIPPDKLSKIFEPFTQADDSITRMYGGTGLGTTIARHLVQVMGGRIGVNSIVGKGTTFWFDLPLTRADPQGVDLTVEPIASSATVLHAKTSASSSPLHAKSRGARILVAEDNPTNQRVARLILESGGHLVTIVNNGEEALDALEHGSFDLALFDLSMPNVSGIEALKLYRFSTRSPIPVLILSANVTVEAITECDRAGASEFISKPLRASILLEAIDRHLSGSQENSESSRPQPEQEQQTFLFSMDSQPIDKTVLYELAKLSNDPTFLERLVKGFKSDADRLLREILDALANGKNDAVRDAAHALKGGAASVGATNLTHLAARLDKANDDALRLKAAEWTAELERVTSVTLAALDAHLDERQRLERHESED